MQEDRLKIGEPLSPYSTASSRPSGHICFASMFLILVLLFLFIPRAFAEDLGLACREPVEKYTTVLSTVEAGTDPSRAREALKCIAKLLPRDEALSRLRPEISAFYRKVDALEPSDAIDERWIHLVREVAEAMHSLGDTSGFNSLSNWLTTVDLSQPKHRKAFELIALFEPHQELLWPGYLAVLKRIQPGKDDSVSRVCLVGHVAMPPSSEFALALADLVVRQDGFGRSLPAQERDGRYGGEARETCFRALVGVLQSQDWKAVLETTSPTPIQRAMLVEAVNTFAPTQLSLGELEHHSEEFRGIIELARKWYTFEDWPGKANSNCVTYSAKAELEHAEESWCYACTRQGDYWAATFVFYPNIDADTCTLGHVSATSESWGKDVLDLARSSVQSILGNGSEVLPAETQERGYGLWKSVRMWKDDYNRAYLYTDGRRAKLGRPYSTGFLWRYLPKVGTPPTTRAVSEEVEDESDESSAFRENLSAACKEAGLPDCDQSIEAVINREEDQIRTTLGIAMRKLRTIDKLSNRHAPLAFWVDQLSSSLPMVDENGDTGAEFLRKLGFEIFTDPSYERDVLRRTLLLDLALNHQDTVWGEIAFLEATSRGWVSACCCDTGRYQFRMVAERGDAFLATHPNSSVARNVLYHVGKAYETWWSLSKIAPYEQEDSDDDPWWEKGEKARLRAIEIYAGLMEARYGSRYAHLKASLFKLKRNIDTGERSYSCGYGEERC